MQLPGLFTDVILPGGMSGAEVAAAARGLHPRLPVLFTSGYTRDTMLHDGKLDASIDLLSKPYRPQQLAARLRQALAGGNATSG